MNTNLFKVCLFLLCGWTITVFGDQPRLLIDTGGHSAKIQDVIFTASGRSLVSAGYDKVVRIWDLQTGRTVRTIRGEIGDGPSGQIFALALSSDDKYLAVGGMLPGDAPDREPIRIHDFQTGDIKRLITGHENVVLDLAFAPDGQRLASASADNTVVIWDVDTGTAIHRLKGHRDHVLAVAFSTDGRRVVSGGKDHNVRLWDAQTGDLIREMKGHRDTVLAVAFSPDGRYIGSGSDDKTVRLWDARSGELVKLLGQQESAVTSLSFSADGSRALTGAGWGGGGYECTLFSVPSGNILGKFKHDNVVLATAVSPNGNLAATAGGDEDEIFLWDTETGRYIQKLAGRGRIVWSVGFARDGRSVAYGNLFDHTSPKHYLGPLQRVIHLNDDGDFRVDQENELKKEEVKEYSRALDRYGEYGLRTRRGRHGYQAVLQILRAGEVVHEIERDPSTGFRHRSYTFTHDGKYIASGGSNGTLTLYSTATTETIRQFVGHAGDVFDVAVSPDGRTLVSGSEDRTIRLWDIGSGINLLTVFIGVDGEWVAWTQQGYYASSLHGDKYFGWHVNRGADRAAEYYSAERFQKTLYRPDVVPEYLDTRDLELSLMRADRERNEKVVQQPDRAAADVSTMLPPMIHVSSPASKQSVVEEKVLRISGVAQSNTLPITDVRILLNGVQVANIKGYGRFKAPLDLEIDLKAGENNLSIIALHERASSAPEIRKVLYTGGRDQADRPNLVLLVIGISKYRADDLRLDYAAEDARAVVDFFETHQGGIFEEIKVMALSDEQATRYAIRKGLEWLKKEGTENDIRVLFLSGHGDLDPSGNYYFLSVDHRLGDDYDINGIPRAKLYDPLLKVPGRKILMVDTCRAGAVAGTKRKGKVDFTRVVKEVNRDYTGLITLAASTDREVSEENRIWGHGAFTKALLEGLSGQADGYGGKKDGSISTDELGAWVKERVKILTEGRQHAIYDKPNHLPAFPLMAVREPSD